MANTHFPLLQVFFSLYTIAIKLLQSLPLLFCQFYLELLIQKELKAVF
jgi:hypothetical protein